jgi:23S rRNA pseudouridine2605 synthase
MRHEFDSDAINAASDPTAESPLMPVPFPAEARLQNMEQRLQKLIAAAGIASRREAERLISAGLVTVNGKLVTALGTKADPGQDHIKVRGKLINTQLEQRDRTYILLNKPKGYLSSLSDAQGRPLVTRLLPVDLGRLHPVGRLDFNSEGLLLLTDDGDFTSMVTAARNRISKVYEVKVQGQPTEQALERLRDGIVIEGRRTAPAVISRLRSTSTNAWFEVVGH